MKKNGGIGKQGIGVTNETTYLGDFKRKLFKIQLLTYKNTLVSPVYYWGGRGSKLGLEYV